MSAERLREAASLMRERAEAATPGPWRQEFYRDGELLDDGTGGMDDHETAGSGVYAIDQTSHEGYCLTEFDAGRPADAAHIAALSPPVATALADWLDSEAARFGFLDTDAPSQFAVVCESALAVADAYLEAAS